MFNWLDRFKRCCGRYWVHTYGAWYSVSSETPCIQKRRCVYCGIKQDRVHHHWDEGDTFGFMMELRSMHPQGYIEPQKRYTCTDCKETCIVYMCDR